MMMILRVFILSSFLIFAAKTGSNLRKIRRSLALLGIPNTEEKNQNKELFKEKNIDKDIENLYVLSKVLSKNNDLSSNRSLNEHISFVQTAPPILRFARNGFNWNEDNVPTHRSELLSREWRINNPQKFDKTFIHTTRIDDSWNSVSSTPSLISSRNRYETRSTFILQDAPAKVSWSDVISKNFQNIHATSWEHSEKTHKIRHLSSSTTASWHKDIRTFSSQPTKKITIPIHNSSMKRNSSILTKDNGCAQNGEQNPCSTYKLITTDYTFTVRPWNKNSPRSTKATSDSTKLQQSQNIRTQKPHTTTGYTNAFGGRNSVSTYLQRQSTKSYEQKPTLTPTYTKASIGKISISSFHESTKSYQSKTANVPDYLKPSSNGNGKSTVHQKQSTKTYQQKTTYVPDYPKASSKRNGISTSHQRQSTKSYQRKTTYAPDYTTPSFKRNGTSTFRQRQSTKGYQQKTTYVHDYTKSSLGRNNVTNFQHNQSTKSNQKKLTNTTVKTKDSSLKSITPTSFQKQSTRIWQQNTTYSPRLKLTTIKIESVNHDSYNDTTKTKKVENTNYVSRHPYTTVRGNYQRKQNITMSTNSWSSNTSKKNSTKNQEYDNESKPPSSKSIQAYFPTKSYSTSTTKSYNSSVFTKRTLIPQIFSKSTHSSRTSNPNKNYSNQTTEKSHEDKISPDEQPSHLYSSTRSLSDINLPQCGFRDAIRKTDLNTSNTHNTATLERGTNDKRGSQIFQRIVGGTEAEPFSWPWVAALYRVTQNGGNRFLCAGSLINEFFVLTAAHVFTPVDLRSSSFVVMLGTHTAKEAVAEYAVASVLQHPRYQQRYYYNDIALLRLERQVNFNNYVMPVCLPSPDAPFLKDTDLAGKTVTVMGWGDESFGGVTSRVLKEASFPILSRKSCNDSYILVASDKYPDGITADLLCAGAPNGGKDACQGDSGGPLTTLQSGRYTQVGIVSFGYSCGDKNFPGVYTKVAAYLQWISEKSQCEQYYRREVAQ